MDESSRLSPPAIQHHNKLLYEHATEKMVEAMFIYFPSCQHSEVLCSKKNFMKLEMDMGI